MRVIVQEKGQVTIPLEFRRKLGIQAGTALEIDIDGAGLRAVVDPIRKDRKAADCIGISGYQGERVPDDFDVSDIVAEHYQAEK
jgi:AbrB family looped-hinge helix DNA binding protein